MAVACVGRREIDRAWVRFDPECGVGVVQGHAAGASSAGQPTHSTSSTVDAALAKHAQRALTAAGYDAVTVLTGDGTLGHRERAPYDRVS